MEDVCDICGNKNIPRSNYCGSCGVDLKEDKTETPYQPRKKRSSKNKRKEKPGSTKDKITWCEIVQMMRSFRMTFPMFLLLNILFAEGKQDLGFCDCHVCMAGYREFYAQIENLEGKKKLKPSSREVVIKSLETDIPSISFNISKFLTRESKSDNADGGKLERTEKNNKISIEIEAHVLEGVVFHILSSEKGQALIRKYSE